MRPGLVLSLHSEVSECGDVVSGEIVDDGGAASAGVVLVKLVGTVRALSDASTAPAVVSSEPVSLGPDGPMTFEVSVPADGPISFEGVTLVASWAVEVTREADGEALLRQAVTILPAGGVAVWARLDAPPPAASSET